MQEPTTTISKLVEQAPVAAALLVLVWFFLNYIRNRDAQSADKDSKATEALGDIAQTCHQSHETVNQMWQQHLDTQSKMFERTLLTMGESSERQAQMLNERVAELTTIQREGNTALQSLIQRLDNGQ